VKPTRRFGKLSVLALALVLALGGLGIGYASWTDTVVVEETVTTGNVCVEFVTPVYVTDQFAPPPIYPTQTPDWTCDPGITNVRDVSPPKNVAWGEAVYLDTDGDSYYDTVQVTLHDVYPCYYNNVSFHVHNCGTIPVIMDSVTLVYDTTTQVIDHDGVYSMDLSGNGVDDFEIRWGDHLGAQFEPSDEAEISFGMHMLQDEDPTIQDNSFTFYIYLHFVQWNMAP